MAKSLPVLSALCLVCLPSLASGGGLVFRQYRDPTSCRLLGGEVLLVRGQLEGLNARYAELSARCDASLFVTGVAFSQAKEVPAPRIDLLPNDALLARCGEAEQSPVEDDLAISLRNTGSAVVAASIHPSWGTEIGQSGGPATGSLSFLNSPTSGVGAGSRGFADAAADPGLVLRLAMVLAVSWLPLFLRLRATPLGRLTPRGGSGARPGALTAARRD